MSSHVLTGLLKRRAELAGEIHYLDNQIQRKMADLGALDGAILVFEPAYKLDTLRPKTYRPPALRHTELTRRILGILREAATSLGAWQIAEALLRGQGQPTSDNDIQRMRKRVMTALNSQKKRGVLAAESEATHGIVWRVPIPTVLQPLGPLYAQRR